MELLPREEQEPDCSSHGNVDQTATVPNNAPADSDFARATISTPELDPEAEMQVEGNPEAALSSEGNPEAALSSEEQGNEDSEDGEDSVEGQGSEDACSALDSEEEEDLGAELESQQDGEDEDDYDPEAALAGLVDEEAQGWISSTVEILREAFSKRSPMSGYTPFAVRGWLGAPKKKNRRVFYVLPGGKDGPVLCADRPKQFAKWSATTLEAMRIFAAKGGALGVFASRESLKQELLRNGKAFKKLYRAVGSKVKWALRMRKAKATAAWATKKAISLAMKMLDAAIPGISFLPFIMDLGLPPLKLPGFHLGAAPGADLTVTQANLSKSIVELSSEGGAVRKEESMLAETLEDHAKDKAKSALLERYKRLLRWALGVDREKDELLKSLPTQELQCKVEMIEGFLKENRAQGAGTLKAAEKMPLTTVQKMQKWKSMRMQEKFPMLSSSKWWHEVTTVTKGIVFKTTYVKVDFKKKKYCCCCCPCGTTTKTFHFPENSRPTLDRLLLWDLQGKPFQQGLDSTPLPGAPPQENML